MKRHELALLVQHGAVFGTLWKKADGKDVYTIISHFEHDTMMPNCT